MKNIILASTSPRRKKLLEKLKLKFEIAESNYEEDMDLPMKPKELARFLSKGKVKDLTEKYRSHLIIGADTFIVLDKKILGKPLTPEKARETLKSISGKCLSVISGITVMDTKNQKTLSRSLETKVYIKKLSEKEIENYIQSGEPLDKAGAFGIQGLGSILVEKIEGDYYNVVGLSLNLLAKMLKKFGVNVI